MSDDSTLLSDPAASNTNADPATSSNSSSSAEGGAKTEDKITDPGQKQTEAAPPAEGEKGKEGDKTAAPVVPEKYEFKLPDGITLDESLAGEFTTVAKELKLTQEQAQKLVDIQAKASLAHADSINASYQKQVEEWKKESIKNLGSNYQQELGYSTKFVEKFGSPELKQLFKDTGIGNHPLLVATFVKAGKAMAEDRLIEGQSANGEASLADKIYGKKK